MFPRSKVIYIWIHISIRIETFFRVSINILHFFSPPSLEMFPRSKVSGELTFEKRVPARDAPPSHTEREILKSQLYGYCTWYVEWRADF